MRWNALETFQNIKDQGEVFRWAISQIHFEVKNQWKKMTSISVASVLFLVANIPIIRGIFPGTMLKHARNLANFFGFAGFAGSLRVLVDFLNQALIAYFAFNLVSWRLSCGPCCLCFLWNIDVHSFVWFDLILFCSLVICFLICSHLYMVFNDPKWFPKR